jgi:hypothetical protein
VVAATLKQEGLAPYWKVPVEDRDWDGEVITKLLDGLIAIGAEPVAV